MQLSSTQQPTRSAASRAHSTPSPRSGFRDKTTPGKQQPPSEDSPPEGPTICLGTTTPNHTTELSLPVVIIQPHHPVEINLPTGILSPSTPTTPHARHTEALRALQNMRTLDTSMPPTAEPAQRNTSFVRSKLIPVFAATSGTSLITFGSVLLSQAFDEHRQYNLTDNVLKSSFGTLMIGIGSIVNIITLSNASKPLWRRWRQRSQNTGEPVQTVPQANPPAPIVPEHLP